MTAYLGSLRSDLNIAAKIIKASHEPQDSFGAIASGEVISTEVMIWNSVLPHMPHGSEHGGGNRQDGFFRATTAAQTQELGLQVSVLHPNRSPGGGDQCGFQPRGAFASTGGAAFAGALVISRAHGCPGEQVPGGGKARHVGTDLRQ